MVGDFNGDGVSDLVSADDGVSDSLSVLLGNSNRRFGSPRLLSKNSI
jgi:hypothetical protein